nr:retrovirus-related Pol polyprotein from transposon TNT 1-94 [Tanacetum cinerariifolium]
MLKKDNYVPWSSRIIRYARSRPNGKMIVDSIENGPYVRRMIATPGELDLPVSVPVLESFHKQTDEELTETDIKRMDADDQAIQTILLGLPEDVYAAVDSCETAKEIWERVRQMMKGSNIGEQEKKAKLFNEWEKFTSTNSGGNQNGLVVVPGIANQSGTGNVVVARAETQLLIAQKEEAGIQLQAKEFDFIATAGDLDEIEEVNENCILMANLQHASTSGTQFENAPVYDADGSAEVQLNDNCYDNEIFNMFTQEEQYTDLLEPIPEPQLMPQNDNHVTFVAPSMVQSEGTVETSFAPNEEIRAHQETVYRNLVDQVAQVNMVNCNMRATNAELKSKLARYKIQEERVEISPEKYDKLEKCYQKSIYQEQCLTSKINALHLSSAKQITTLNDEISNLNKQLSKEKSSIYSLMEEKKKLKHDFKIQEDKFLDKEVDLAARIKDLKNILLKRDQTEIALIINQVDARVQNFKIQFLQEAAKFVRDFKSLAKEADESLDKQKSLELEIERLLKASFRLVHTARTRRPQPKGKTRNARVPSESKSSEVKKNLIVEEHRRTLLLSKNQKTMSSECNNIKLAIRNDKSKIVVQICLWCVDSGCSKHMTGNIKLLVNFVWKFLGTVRFRNDHIAAILGYGDLKWGILQSPGFISLKMTTLDIREFIFSEQRMKRQKNILIVLASHMKLLLQNTPQQNEVVERRNRMLVEAARTMLIFSHAPLFLWAEAIATACYTQNRSIIHRRFNKTPYELIQGRKPDIFYLYVFGALCYPKNDREDIGKLGAKGDIGFFIGYSANSVAYKVYNWRTRKIMETMNVTFDELSAMAFEQNSLRPGLQSMTSRQISSELELTYAPSTITP